MEVKKRKTGFVRFSKRFLASLLVIMLIGQMESGSMLINGIQSLLNLVEEVQGAYYGENARSYMVNATNHPNLMQESGNMIMDDFFDIWADKHGGNTYIGVAGYCMVDPNMNYQKIGERASEFIDKIKVMNEEFDKEYEGDAGGGIEYSPKAANSDGYGNVNFFTSGSGSAGDAYTVYDDAAIPAKLTVNSSVDGYASSYIRKMDVTSRVNQGGRLNYKFTMRVLSTDGSYVNITLSNNGKVLAQKMASRGSSVNMTGSVDAKSLAAENGRYYIEVKIESARWGATMSNLGFYMSGTQETKFVNMYLTAKPIPAGLRGEYEANTGADPADKAHYTIEDEMYVVLQFTDSVSLRMRSFLDTQHRKDICYNMSQYFYKAYPRLALAVTDANGVEQNKNQAIYADYFGVMDGFDANGNIVANNSLIFKLDISGWENKDWCIAGLADNLNKNRRSGNMDWIYKNPGHMNGQAQTLRDYWTRWKEKSGDDRFRGAILDSNKKEIAVVERAALNNVTVLNKKGEEEEALPIYHGSIPSIKEVVITPKNGNEYAKKGDWVDIKVVFSALLDESLPTPTFYLNDYSPDTTAMPGDEDWDGTVVSNGVYGDTRMVPLMAHWKIDEDSTENIWYTDSAVMPDNHTGAATFEITGNNTVEGSTTYYRVVDETTVAMQKGDIFDPTGWSVYTEPVWLTGLPTVIKQVKQEGNSIEYIRLVDGGFVEICEVVPQLVDKENGEEPTEQLVVHKFGTSDEIDTSADSEVALEQENTAPGTVISYSVQLTGSTDVNQLYLLEEKDSYTYEYEPINYWYSNYATQLKIDGEVRNVYGKKLATPNFGIYDSEGKFLSIGRQYSYVETENYAPRISNTQLSYAGYSKQSDLEDARAFKISDYVSVWDPIIFNALKELTGQYVGFQNGVKEYRVDAGPVNANIKLDVDGTVVELAKGDKKTVRKYVDTSTKYTDYIYVSSTLLPDESGNYNRVTIPLTLTVYDYSGNTAVYSFEQTVGLPYAEFETYGDFSCEPVTMTYSNEEYLEEDGRFVSYPDVEEATDDFEAEYFQMAILPQGEEPDENTKWYSLADGDEQNITIEDDNGNPVTARFWNAGNNPVLWVDTPVRGAVINKTIYWTYKTPKSFYQYTAYDEEGKPYPSRYKTVELSYDSSDVPELIDLSKTTTYRETVVEKPQNPADGVSIKLADGELVDGKLKRKNFYRFNIQTDEYTKVDYIFRTGWGGETVTGTIEPNTTTTLDTRDLGIKYNAENIFNGSAWLADYTVDFIPRVIERHTTTEYTHEYSEEGELLNSTSEIISVVEKEGEFVNSQAKYYRLKMLDEEFVRRSEAYYDFHSYDSNATSNRLFLEVDLDYNSLNGYSDYLNYMSRDMAYTSTLFDNTTMVLGEEVSEYLQPETDIDFANSYIYIYPVKATEMGNTVDYVKDGDCVRKIPLPANFREITYNAAPEGYVPNLKTVLGFEADLNAYVTEYVTDDNGEFMLDENGNKIEQLGMPVEGTYGAFVEIATYLEDEDGNPIVISSNHYDVDYNTGEEVISQIDIPEVVFTYDYTAPEGSLYFKEEVLDYIKGLEDLEECKETFEGYEAVTYNLTMEKENGETYYSDQMLIDNVNSKEFAVVKPGDSIELYVANPTLELGGFKFTEGNTTYDWSYYAESGDAYNANEYCKISYAFVPMDSFDVYGNMLPDVMESIEWQHDMDEYDRYYNKSMNITVPEDMKESCYVLVKFEDSTGNETAIFKKRIIPDITGPNAVMYQYEEDGTSYVQLIQIFDDYSKENEIYVTSDNGITYSYGAYAASAFKATVTGEEEYTVTLSDKCGNETTVFLSENGLKLTAPIVTNLTEDEAVKGTMLYAASEEDMLADREALAASAELQELIYDTESAKGNGYISFAVLPGTGEAVQVDYAWNSDSFKSLNNLQGDTDFGYMWKDATVDEKLTASGMVNLVVSDEPDVSGAYAVEGQIVLPKDAEAKNYVLTIRFRNEAGLYSYYTLGYAVNEGEYVTAEIEENDNYTNKVRVNFSEPVKVVTPVYNSNAKEYKTYADMYFDANGNYEIKVKDLQGVEQTIPVSYYGKPEFAPDIHMTLDTDGVYVDLDMGYTRGYAMTFAKTEGDAYSIMPSEEEGRIVTYGETTAYQYALAMVTDNTEFTIGLLAEDGVTTETYTYVVDSFIENEEVYEVTYSRDISTTTEENAALPVDAEISIPEGAEILSADGNIHTFYKNGSYTFEVKTLEGKIKKVTAEVDCITEAESDGEDDVAPMYDVVKFIRNQGELMNITAENSADVMTNATVQVKVYPLDINMATGELNPVTMTVTSKDGNVTQNTEDEYLLTFTDNDTVTVTLTDPSGNKTTFDIVVDNINKEIPITGKIRYVRYGLEEIRAFIALEEGIKLRSLDGIQMVERSDGSIEYYHSFTQNGSFAFLLEGQNGSTADVYTKFVEVVREPLVLSVSGKTPEVPTWGEGQVVTVGANIDMESAYLTDEEGNTINDMEISIGSRMILAKFTKNRTVICHATAENGSKAEITLTVDDIPTDTTAPKISYTISGAVTDKQRQVTMTITDMVNTDFVTEDTNLSIHVEGNMVGYSETVPVMTDENGVTTITKKASFTVTQPGTYSVYAYDMSDNFTNETFDVEIDNVKPVLTNLSEEFTETASTAELKFTISNEAGTITCAGKTYKISNAGEEVAITVRKNGMYSVVAADLAGNVSEQQITISHLDDTKPEITLAGNGIYKYSYRTVTTQEALTEELLKNVTITDNSSEEVSVKVEYTMDVDFTKNGKYVAIVTATDAYGNSASEYIQFSMLYNEVTRHKELEEFGVNGEVLVEDGIITTDTTKLEFQKIPEGAVVTYAQGRNTGAQMKYRGTVLDGNTVTVDEKGMYTIMVKLADYTVHVYYVAIN